MLEIRIADFGLAKIMAPDEKCNHKCGTPTYIAPEILRSEYYSFKADIFSLGSIMYNLASGRYLFNHPDPNKLLLLNKNCDLSHVLDNSKNLSKHAKDLMMKMLNPNP
jgi:serine/threonine protein kinase